MSQAQKKWRVARHCLLKLVERSFVSIPRGNNADDRGRAGCLCAEKRVGKKCLSRLPQHHRRGELQIIGPAIAGSRAVLLITCVK